MGKFPLKLYDTETTKLLTQQEFLLIGFGNLKKKCFMKLLNEVAPLKAKFLRTNHFKFVAKDVGKANILRTKLRNRFLKKKILEARTKYSKQRNICISLAKKAKQNYRENLHLKDIDDYKKQELLGYNKTSIF